MIRVVDPTQFPAFPAGQSEAALAGAVNDGKRYNNVSIIWTAGTHVGGTALVDLGVDALDCMFDVTQIEISGNKMGLNLNAGAGSNATTFKHAAHPTWYKDTALLASGHAHTNTADNAIDVDSNIQNHPNLALTCLVHNVTQDSWSIIDSWGADVYKANTTMIGGGTSHSQGDLLEFHAAPTMIGIYNIDRSEWCPVTSYSYAAPDELKIAASGLVVGDYCNMAGGDIGPTFDLMHPPNVTISPPPSVYHSGVSSRLRIRSTSEFQLEYLVRWRT
jgi:hypothetical protein